MSAGLIFDNLVAYSLQIGMLIGVAAMVPTLLRLRQPGAKLLYWQILLAACLLLPLQPWKQMVTTGTVRVTTAITAIPTVTHTAPVRMLPRSEIALLIALLGVAIRLGWLAVGFWKLRRYRRHSRPLEPAPTWSVEASLRISDDVASPVTFGWRKPVVLLPANFPELAAPVQEAILCHEVMHVRRRDWLFTVAEELVRAIFWFHPAIWWLLGEIGLAREQEVDRLAIEITQEREEYMDALMAIAGARAQLDLAPAPLFLRKRHLKHRVILILKEARMSKTHLISTLATSLGLLAAACWLVTGAFPLTAQPQVVNDGPGVTVNLNGAPVMHRTRVEYPFAVREHGVQGSVSVQLKLDAKGNVSDAQVLSGPEELRKGVLQSGLQWHFGQALAGTTRTVQITFELPNEPAVETLGGTIRVVPGVVGGVQGGVSGGVLGGVIGSVPTAAPRAVVNPQSAQSMEAYREAMEHGRIGSIRVLGLPDDARTQLLASLPVREGDQMSPDLLERVRTAATAFDEHLSVGRSVSTTPSGEPAVSLILSVPGSQVMYTPPPTPPSPSVASAEGPSRIKVGGAVASALIIRKVQPVYPELAISARVQGVVHLAVVIAKDGTVQELHSLGGPALLIQAAMDAVKQWQYKPTLLNGQPVQVETTADIDFTLNQ